MAISSLRLLSVCMFLNTAAWAQGVHNAVVSAGVYNNLGSSKAHSLTGKHQFLRPKSTLGGQLNLAYQYKNKRNWIGTTILGVGYHKTKFDVAFNTRELLPNNPNATYNYRFDRGNFYLHTAALFGKSFAFRKSLSGHVMGGIGIASFFTSKKQYLGVVYEYQGASYTLAQINARSGSELYNGRLMELNGLKDIMIDMHPYYELQVGVQRPLKYGLLKGIHANLSITTGMIIGKNTSYFSSSDVAYFDHASQSYSREEYQDKYRSIGLKVGFLLF